jgi:hypothetical protein
MRAVEDARMSRPARARMPTALPKRGGRVAATRSDPCPCLPSPRDRAASASDNRLDENRAILRSGRAVRRYARATSALHWITVDKGVLMIRSSRRALTVAALVVGMALLAIGVVLFVQAMLVDERLARLVVFAGLTVLVTAVVMGFAVVRSRRGGRMRLH